MSTTETKQTPEQQKYDVFLEERKNLLATAKEATTQYVKAIMMLSAGALALSITFVKEMAPNPDPDTFPLIIAGWVSI